MLKDGLIKDTGIAEKAWEEIERLQKQLAEETDGNRRAMIMLNIRAIHMHTINATYGAYGVIPGVITPQNKES